MIKLFWMLSWPHSKVLLGEIEESFSACMDDIVELKIKFKLLADEFSNWIINVRPLNPDHAQQHKNSGSS